MAKIALGTPWSLLSHNKLEKVSRIVLLWISRLVQTAKEG